MRRAAACRGSRPIARALLKARAGDSVTLRTPSGDEALEILEVSYR